MGREALAGAGELQVAVEAPRLEGGPQRGHGQPGPPAAAGTKWPGWALHCSRALLALFFLAAFSAVLADTPSCLETLRSSAVREPTPQRAYPALAFGQHPSRHGAGSQQRGGVGVICSFFAFGPQAARAPGKHHC